MSSRVQIIVVCKNFVRFSCFQVSDIGIYTIHTSVRGNVASMIKQCCDTPGYILYRIPFVSETCGYDLIDKTEKPSAKFKLWIRKACLSIMREVLEFSGYC